MLPASFTCPADEVDALYVEFRHLEPGTLEILDASQVLGRVEGRIVFEIVPALAGATPAR
jgi:hypothetical protein